MGTVIFSPINGAQTLTLSETEQVSGGIVPIRIIAATVARYTGRSAGWLLQEFGRHFIAAAGKTSGTAAVAYALYKVKESMDKGHKKVP